MSDQAIFEAKRALARRGVGRPSQSSLVREHLLARRGAWVPMPELARVSGAYAVHSRVAELRAKCGLVVEHRNRWSDGICCSEYRIP